MISFCCGTIQEHSEVGNEHAQVFETKNAVVLINGKRGKKAGDVEGRKTRTQNPLMHVLINRSWAVGCGPGAKPVVYRLKLKFLFEFELSYLARYAGQPYCIFQIAQRRYSMLDWFFIWPGPGIDKCYDLPQTDWHQLFVLTKTYILHGMRPSSLLEVVNCVAMGWWVYSKDGYLHRDCLGRSDMCLIKPTSVLGSNTCILQVYFERAIEVDDFHPWMVLGHLECLTRGVEEVECGHVTVLLSVGPNVLHYWGEILSEWRVS